jgi:hypothetical protein
MGLDMYLRGDIYIGAFDANYTPKPLPCLESESYRLGYWRKHPNLHGYIVRTFASGKDECQEIPLSEADIVKIMDAIRAEELPFTKGFFFGASEGTPEEMAEDLDIFQRALDWMRTEKKGFFRSVIYQASW